MKINKKLKLLLLLICGLGISLIISCLCGNFQTAEAAWSPISTVNHDTSVTSLVKQDGTFTESDEGQNYSYSADDNKIIAHNYFKDSGIYEDVSFTVGNNDNYKFDHFAYYIDSYHHLGGTWNFYTNSYVENISSEPLGCTWYTHKGNYYQDSTAGLLAAFADSITTNSSILGTFDNNKQFFYMFSDIDIQLNSTGVDISYSEDATVNAVKNGDKYTISFINNTYSDKENGTATFNFTPSTHAKINGFKIYDLNKNLIATLDLTSNTTNNITLTKETPMILEPYGIFEGINVSGNIIDAVSKANLKDVNVTITYNDTTKTTTTDKDGNFSLTEQIVPTTDITFTFTKDGYEDLTKTVTVEEAWYGGAIYVEAQMVPIVTPTPDPTPVTPISDSTSNSDNNYSNTKTSDNNIALASLLTLLIAGAVTSGVYGYKGTKRNNSFN